MAEITTVFDTKEKTLQVNMNGKVMKDVTSVNFYKYGEQAGVEIHSVVREEDEDIVKVTKIMASDKGDIIEESDGINPLTEKLVKALFPNKYKNCV